MMKVGSEDCLAYIAKSFMTYEDSVSKQAYSVDVWISYLDAIDDVSSPTQIDEITIQTRKFVGQRALAVLPRSYKLWKSHWEFLVKYEKNSNFDIAEVLHGFECCLLMMHRYPRAWIDYFEFIETHPGCCSITYLRRLVNRSLQALALTQHNKIWPVILRIFQDEAWPIPLETRIRVLTRHALLDPAYKPELAEFLTRHQKWGHAALVYQDLLNHTTVSREEYWQAFALLCTQHPTQVDQAGVPWEDIVKAVLEDPQEQSSLQGLLWAQLADSWIRRGEFEIARSVLEEGLLKVRTVRDFTLVYDAYLELEQGLLEAAAEDDVVDGEEGDMEVDPEDWDILLDQTQNSKIADLELSMARAEHLTSRRPLLLNAVVLRQNPHNVGEWLDRSLLFQKFGQPRQAAAALEEALRTVDAKQAVNGAPSQLVSKLVEIYEMSSLQDARGLLERICKQHEFHFQKADDLAECWAAWIEFELRQENWDEALSLARQAVASGSGIRKLNLTKSLRLWDLLLDLEESLGTTQTTEDAYNRAIDIKAATVQHILNYADFLSDKKYFEGSFKAYERGLEMFPFPHPGAKLLWKAYLKSFMDRYGGTKVERSRDLFQRCIEECPPEVSAEFYIMNGSFEEQYGLAKRALSVYKQMCQNVPKSEKLAAYRLFIAKTTKYLGITTTRDVYQEAIELLTEEDSAKICLDFAKMETSLQQVERARAVYTYGAQMADPRRIPEYWAQWNEFEVAYGNEETFREMLRVKRSVEAAFSTVNYNASGMTEKPKPLSNEEAISMIAGQEGVDVDDRRTIISGFVPSSNSKTNKRAVESLGDVEERVAKLRKMTGKDNDDNDEEIDIDDIDAEIEAAAAEGASAVDHNEESTQD